MLPLAPPSPGQIASTEIATQAHALIEAAVDGDKILYSEDREILGADDLDDLRAAARKRDLRLEMNEDGDLIAVAR